MSGRYTYAFLNPIEQVAASPSADRALPIAFLMDRLVPGVQLIPRPPMTMGMGMEALYAARRLAFASGKWKPTGYTAPANAAVLLSRWAWDAEITLAHEGEMPGHDARAIPELFESGEWVTADLPSYLLGKLDSEPLTFYQRQVPALADRNPLLHWAPGCLAGDTEIIVNRGGAARRMAIADFVFRHNGGIRPGSGYRRWREASEYPSHVPSMDAEGFMRKNVCVAAIASGARPVWRMRTTEGHEIKATHDHRFWTADGWRRLGDLLVGVDRVAINFRPKGRGKDVPSYTTDKAYYPETCSMQHHPFHVARDVARTREIPHVDGSVGVYEDVRHPRVVATHRLVAEARENGLSFEEFTDRVREGRIEGLRFLDPKEWQVHHKNRDTTDFSVDNLETLSTIEHLRLHGIEGGWKHCAYRAKYVAVESIEYVGEEETFDLTMADPLNNFVANDFVVHNSGKSRGALIYAACRPGPIVIVTPSQAKTTLHQQVLRYFPQGEVFEWKAPSLRRKKDISLDDWIARCRETGRIPVMIVGHETFPDAWRQGDVRIGSMTAWPADEWRKRFGNPGGPVTLIFDESHKFRSHKRYTSAVQSDGSLKFRAATTTGGSMPLSLALAEASRWASRRISLTGTPLANRVEQLWVQLDLLEPGAWGSWASFALRYAGMIEAQGGGLEPMKALGKEAPPNTEELRSRLLYTFHHVTYQESHGALPPKRRQTTYIPIDQQLREQGSDWASYLKAASKKSPAHLAEARLMLAASRKRGWVFKRVLDFVQHGEGRDEGSKGKVCVITGRRRDADYLRRHMLATIPEGCPVWMGHGGIERDERDKMIEEYMAHPGPCVLVGTIDSFGIAVNLQDTDLGIVAQLPMTWDQLWQLENRWARLGMTRKVLVEFPIAVGTIDEQVAQAFLEKLPAIGALTADAEVKEVGESLRGLDDPESLLDSILSKIISSEEEDHAA